MINNYLLSLSKDKLSNDAIIDHPDVLDLINNESLDIKGASVT